MVSADSSVEPVRALFLFFTRGLAVPLTSPALTLTATVTQNKNSPYLPKYIISISERSADITGELELIGKTALYGISQG